MKRLAAKGGLAYTTPVRRKNDIAIYPRVNLTYSTIAVTHLRARDVHLLTMCDAFYLSEY